MNMRRTTVHGLVLILGSATIGVAGPLDPPAGPITSTFKTLTEVEPRTAINLVNTPGDDDASPSLFKITQPGSYYLCGNVTGVAGKHGIEIASSGVTLDLNGFELLGVAGSLDGVTTDVNGLGSIAVVNGSVRGWGEDGVDVARGTLTGARLERLRASGNGVDGLRVRDGSVVTECVSSSNGRDGIFVGDDTVVSRSSCDKNSGNGITANQGCLIVDCAASQSGAHGIVVNTLCAVRGNNCTLNGLATASGAGIRVTGFGTRVEANNCVFADRGIVVEIAGCFITRNTCAGNSVANWDVVAGNAILVVQAAPAPAVAGAAGGRSPGSTDPNANYTY